MYTEEQVKEAYRTEGIEIGREEGREEMIRNMYKVYMGSNISKDRAIREITKLSGMTEEKVIQIIQN